MTDAGAIAVIGAGGHAKVVIATLRAAGERVEAVFDQDESKWDTEVLAVPVLGGVDRLAASGLRRAVLAIGDNRARRRLSEELDLDWAVGIHPLACVHASARLGPGCVVFAGGVIQPQAVLGAHCIVNTGASVDHDCQVADFVHLAPGARLAGSVAVGEGALVGIGSSVVPSVRVGAWSTIGAGAAVVDDVADGATVTGVPAR